MHFFNDIVTQLEQQLGMLWLPLLACSLVALGIIVEKTVVLLYQQFKRKAVPSSAPAFGEKKLPALMRDGLTLLTRHREEDKSLREEIAAIWLLNQRTHMSSGIRMLQAIALLTPLLGLLGTVLGLIRVFDGLAKHQGPIEPALLADGLGLAMYTTAAGLMIALPALAAAHFFQIWIDKMIRRAEHTMNQANLLILGIELEPNHD